MNVPEVPRTVDRTLDIRLVISDIILPEMNGAKMSRQLLKLMPELMFLFMSSYSADSQWRYGKLSEDSNFISKLFKLYHLLKMVHQLLEVEAAE
jgi:two-component system, cell cycle sensor histidine kinase and response regulator CckA